MTLHEVVIHETVVHTIFVNAENETDAYALAEKQYTDGQDEYHESVESYDIESEGITQHTIYEVG
jgi:hypothetical protein